MNIAQRFFWIFCCTFAVFSINAHPLFDSVAKYQFTDASRSLIYLQRIEKIRSTLPDSLKGKYNNELGIYYAIQGENKKALQQFRAALQYAENWTVRRAGAYANIANVYKAIGKYNYANKVLLRAWRIYEKLGEEELQYSVLGEMAANDYYALNWNRSMRRTLTVIRKMEDSENQKFLHVQKQRLANLYFSLGWQNKAIPMYRACEKYYKTQPTEQMNLAYVCINLGDAYIEIRKPLLAIPRYQQAIFLLEHTDRHNFLLAKAKLTEAYLLSHSKMAKRYGFQTIALQTKEKSITAFETAASLLNNVNDKFALRALLSKLAVLEKTLNKSALHPTAALELERGYIRAYHLLGDYKNENLHWRQSVKLRSIINQEKLLSNTEKAITQEKIKTQRLKAQDLELKLQIANIERWLGIVIAMFASSLAGLIYAVSRRKRKVQNIKMDSLREENEEHKLLLEAERRNVELEQELASMKERELTALSLQFYELQESIIEDLKQLEKLEHTPEINRLRKKWARQVKDKNYWQEFELKFTALHPDFLQKLQNAHPSLTKKEADFCALVRLNLSNKEIASLIQISYESVISKKYKLRKKLGYKTENEFFAFLNGLM